MGDIPSGPKKFGRLFRHKLGQHKLGHDCVENTFPNPTIFKYKILCHAVNEEPILGTNWSYGTKVNRFGNQLGVWHKKILVLGTNWLMANQRNPFEIHSMWGPPNNRALNRGRLEPVTFGTRGV